MCAKKPITQIYDVDVLLDKNVSGKCPIPEPVPQPMFVCGFAGVRSLRHARRVVAAIRRSNLAQRAGLDLFRDGGKRRRVAALESHIDALRRLHPLRNLQRLLRLVNVDAYRLLAIDILAGRDGSLEMLYVEEWRGGDLNQIHIGTGGDSLEGVRTAKHQPFGDRLGASARIELVEVLPAGSELIGKEIGK